MLNYLVLLLHLNYFIPPIFHPPPIDNGFPLPNNRVSTESGHLEKAKESLQCLENVWVLFKFGVYVKKSNKTCKHVYMIGPMTPYTPLKIANIHNIYSFLLPPPNNN